MKNGYVVFIVSLISVLFFLFTFSPFLQAQENLSQEAKACDLKVGVVPQFQKRHIFKVWSPLLHALEKKTGCHFELVGSKTIIDFEKSFKEGEYDLAYMNPYHAVIAKKTQGYEPLIRSGSKKLEGILVVRKDSPIQNIKELDKKDVAFPSPNAFGASLLMRAELMDKHNVTVSSKYVKTHSSVYLHIAKGITTAGGGVARTLSQQPSQIKDVLRVLYTTTPVNAHPLTAHPRIGKEQMDIIQKTLLALSKEQPALFDGIPMKKPVVSSYDDYADIESLGLEDFIKTNE